MRFLSKFGKFLFYLLVIAVLSGIVYYNRANYENAYKDFRVTVGLDKPCQQPIYYSVSEFDQRFGISQADFLNIARQAANLWNSAIGMNLLTYSEDGNLKINLIYDDRQSTTVELNGLGSSIDTGKSSLSELENQYDSLKAAYNSKKTLIESIVATYQTDKNKYEQTVSYWNVRGGAPQTESNFIEKQRQALNLEAQNINQANQSLNAIIGDLNSVASRINSLGQSINQDVSVYNTVSVSNGPEFQEGEYVSDKNGERINIYQYKDYNKLQRVLAHEFGHALGLGHVSDPKAIMYTYNSGINEKLTQADVDELKTVCGIK